MFKTLVSLLSGHVSCMVNTYLAKLHKNALDTHKRNLCLCLLMGNCNKYRIKTIRKK